MNLDQNFVIFFFAAILVMFFFGKSSNDPDEFFIDDIDLIVDVPILNGALDVLPQLED